MNAHSETQLHRDHLQWAEARALWHDDVRAWESEIAEVEAKLRRVEAALAQQKHDLQVHAAAIRIYQERDGRREHLLVECLRDGNDERGMVLVHAHEGESNQQERQSERHEELKASQRRLMGTLRPLIPIADRLPPSVNQKSPSAES